MKVILGQINTTPGDFGGNVAKILNVLETVGPHETDMVVFPELSICGYLSRDLVFETHYIERNLLALQQIIAFSSNIRDVAIVVGYADHNKTGHGKPFANMLAVVRNGTVMGTYQKHLLPFYDVFDEGRYYEPGTQLLVLNIAGERVGFTICEDIWNDKGSDGYSYEDNPISGYRKLGVKTIVNISSSPFIHDKPYNRLEMLKSVTRSGLTLIYVNQIGGQDDLVFDGHSCVINNGYTVKCLHPSEDPKQTIQIELVDTCGPTSYCGNGSTLKTIESRVKNNHDMILQGLHDYVTKSGFSEIVLGSSGGIDSAVVAALAVQAFGPKKVHCIAMPGMWSSPDSWKDAKILSQNLGCVHHHVPIDHKGFLNQILLPLCTSINVIPEFQEQPQYAPAANENIQARIRGMIVMFFSNAFGALPLTTGNKTELATGYCTLYGDMNGGFAPISDLYKMEVYELARYINKKAFNDIIPVNIIDKAPSAELAPGQTDEASLLPYPILDYIVKSYVEDYVDTFTDLKDRLANSKLFHIEKWAQTETASKDYYRIIKLINMSEFKRRQAAPGIKLSRVAFGSGRRLPIVKKMRM